MAQVSADAARPAQKQQARRQVSRIVPAIPLRLSRRAPAVKPTATAAGQPHKDSVAPKQEAEPPAQQPVVEENKAEEQPAPSAEPPLALETSTATEETEPEPQVGAEASVLASSPAKSQDEDLQPVAGAEGESQNLPRMPEDR